MTVPPNPDVRVSVSRFTQWFQLQQQQQQQQQQQNSSTSHSHGNSRRSSLNDEFAYLNGEFHVSIAALCLEFSASNSCAGRKVSSKICTEIIYSIKS